MEIKMFTEQNDLSGKGDLVLIGVNKRSRICHRRTVDLCLPVADAVFDFPAGKILL